MASTRKREREFKKLKGSAATVADEQREVLEHANKVLREARRQLGDYARSDLAPAAMAAYDKRIKPGVDRGFAAGRAAAFEGRTRVANDVIPAISGAVGSTLAVLATARDPRVRDVAKKAGKAAKKYSKQATKSVRPASSGGGAGKFILLGIGVAAVAAVAYAAWQTLRADDELWIEDVADVEPVNPEA
jgi:hypothetical protein